MPLNTNIPMSFQPPQLESPGVMMNRMAQIQALQDASEEKQLLIAQRRRLLGEQEGLNALLRKNGNQLNEEVFSYAAGMSDPKMREMGFAGLKDMGYRKAFESSLAPRAAAAEAPRMPSMPQNFLTPQESFDSEPVTMASANRFAPPAQVQNVMARNKAYGDPVLENLYDMEERLTAAIATSGGQYADRAKDLLANLRKNIDARLRRYDPATLNQGDVRFAPNASGKFEPIARGPSAVAQLQDAVDAEQDPNRRATLQAALVKAVTHPPVIAYDAQGRATAITPPTTVGGALGTQPIGAGQAIGKPSAAVEKDQLARQETQRNLSIALPQLRDAIKPGGLLDQATSGGIGALTDVVIGATGAATKGAKATASLKVIADLALKMVPRFEGPQSDKDTQSYKDAAGALGDPYKPREERRAAAKTLIEIMARRKNQFGVAGQEPAVAPTDAPVITTTPISGGWRVIE